MKKWIFSILFVLAITAAGVWAISQLLGSASADTPAIPAAVANQSNMVMATAPVNYEQRIMDPAVDLPAREMLIEKIDLQKRADANRQAGELNPANKVVPSFLAAGGAAAEPLQVETGIFEGSDGMVRPSQANITNYWRGIQDGKIVIVFAGSAAGKDQEGMIVVITSSVDPSISDVAFEYFPAPAGIGRLRILGEKDGELSLKDTSGKLLQFQPAGRKYH